MKTHSDLKVLSNNGFEYIYIYYKQNGQLIRINTKYQYKPAYCTKEFLFNSKMPDFETINKRILDKKKLVDEYIGKCIDNHQAITQKELLRLLNANFTKFHIDQIGSVKPSSKLLELYSSFLSIKGQELAPTSYKNYKTLENVLTDYQKHYRITLYPANINSKEFMLKFRNYLTDQCKLIDITQQKRFACLKVFMKYLQENEIYIFKPQVLGYTVKKFESEIVTLSIDDIKKIQNLNLTKYQKWQKVIDVFVLNCYLGLRYTDLMQLKKTDFFTDGDGDIFYKNYNSKTQIQVVIPIMNTALTLLRKYNFEIPTFANAVFNSELKDCLTFFKLFETPVVKHSMINGQIVETSYLKRQLISSHTCRRSFITNSLIANVNVSNLMAASGHRKLSTVSRYMERKLDKADFKKLEK